MSWNRRSFIKQVSLVSVGLTFVGGLPTAALAETGGRHPLPRSTPEQQGVSSAAISSFLDEVAKSKIEFHSIMVVRHGHVITEGWWSPYDAHLKHTLYSLSKSVTATAVGLAIEEGHFSVDSHVLSFFPEDKPKDTSSFLNSLKVKHLLTMSTGHVKDTIQSMRHSSQPWTKTFLREPIEKEPGKFFLYNTGATYMLSAIIQKVTGQTLLDYLRPRLFHPLGISGEDWQTDPLGINTGGYGLRLRTEDIAKFGQLYLQEGKWMGKQVISSAWINDATRTQIASNSSNSNRPKNKDDWAQGYGYQFWRCRPGGYRADGAFGQFCIVMPDYDAVIAITSESFSMQKSMDLVWNHLLPAMNNSSAPLPADAVAHGALTHKLKALRIEPPQLKLSSPDQARLSGKEFMLDTNEFNAETIQLVFKDDTCIFKLSDATGKHEVVCGMNRWVEQKHGRKQTPFPVAERMDVPTLIAGSATWVDDNTLLMTWRLIESAHTNGLTFIFIGNNATIKFHSSISQNNSNARDKRADLKGSYVL